jgi:hypothetical protein
MTTNFLALCEELVAALDPKVILTDGYGPITSLVLRARAILANSSNSMTKCLPEFGTVAYCAAKFKGYPPMLKEQFFPEYNDIPEDLPDDDDDNDHPSLTAAERNHNLQ